METEVKLPASMSGPGKGGKPHEQAVRKMVRDILRANGSNGAWKTPEWKELRLEISAFENNREAW